MKRIILKKRLSAADVLGLINDGIMKMDFSKELEDFKYHKVIDIYNTFNFEYKEQMVGYDNI